tara:strand:- start:1893 stop:2342 length:450 start_codon:yes stop_codon:yes gene_type:complete
MKTDNSVYTVTYPDLHMTDDGMSVLVTSTDSNFIDSVKGIFEKYIYTSIVFYVQPNKTNSETLAWMWNVSTTCDLMIIDIDSCAWEDIMAALIKPNYHNNQVLYYSSKYKRRETARLINATGTNLIVRKVEDIDRFIRLQMNPEGIYDI